MGNTKQKYKKVPVTKFFVNDSFRLGQPPSSPTCPTYEERRGDFFLGTGAKRYTSTAIKAMQLSKTIHFLMCEGKAILLGFGVLFSNENLICFCHRFFLDWIGLDCVSNVIRCAKDVEVCTSC